MTEDTITINGQQAAILFTALELAIADVRDTLASGSKASAPYKSAMTVQLACYEQERARLATTFPELNAKEPA